MINGVKNIQAAAYNGKRTVIYNGIISSKKVMITIKLLQGLSWEFETAGANHSKSSKFKGATQHYVVKLRKPAGARHYCPKIPWVPGTLGTRANSSPA